MRSIKKSRVKRNKVKKRTYRKSRGKGNLSRRSNANKKVKRERKMSKKKNKMKGGSGKKLPPRDLNDEDRKEFKALLGEKKFLLSKIEEIQGDLTQLSDSYREKVEKIETRARSDIEKVNRVFVAASQKIESSRDSLRAEVAIINDKIEGIIKKPSPTEKDLAEGLEDF